MPQDWYVVINGTQRGPLTDAQLVGLARGGFLQPNDLVCQPGTDWVAAGTVPGLFADEPALPAKATPWSQSPPPRAAAIVPTAAAAPVASVAPPQPTFHTASRVSRTPLPRRRNAGAGFLIGAAALLVGAAAAMYVFFQIDPLIKTLTGRDRVEASETEIIILPPKVVTQPAEAATAPRTSGDATPEKKPTMPQPVVDEPPRLDIVDPRKAVAMVRVDAGLKGSRFCTGFFLTEDEGRRGFVTCLDVLEADKRATLVYDDERAALITGFLATLPDANLVLLEVDDPTAKPFRLVQGRPTTGDVHLVGVHDLGGKLSQTRGRLEVGPTMWTLDPPPPTTFHGGPILNGAGEVIGLIDGNGAHPLKIVDTTQLRDLLAKSAPARPLNELGPAQSPNAAVPPDEPPAAAIAKPLPANEPAPNTGPKPRLAIPDEAVYAEKLQLFRKVYGPEIARAKLPADKRALAETFLTAAVSEQDAAVRYVTLREAENLAASLGDASFIERVVHQLATQYQVDPLAALQDALERGITSSSLPESIRGPALAAFGRVEEPAAENRYAEAERFLSIALLGAKKARDPALTKMIERRGVQLADAKRKWEAYVQAAEILKSNPDDPDANTAVGRYLCFTQGRWNAGLPRLAKGSDAALADVAKLAPGDPKDTTACVAAGDAWWKAAESSKPDATRRIEFLLGCRHWYYLVVDELNEGVTKKNIEQILEDLRSELADVPLPNALRLPADLAGRTKRTSLVGRYGGTQQSEEAVELALQWLAQHQLADGFWSLKGSDSAKKARYSKGSDFENAEAATALVLLAFAGCGQTHRSGKHAACVAQGLQALLRVQDPAGNLFHGERPDDALYTQALATAALCELYALTGDKSLKEPCERALRYCLESQDPTLGGWRYRPRSDSDTSVTGWMVAALKSAQVAGLPVPPAKFELVSKYLDLAARGVNPKAIDAGSKYAYMPGKEHDRVMTASGLMCRIHLGWKPDERHLIEGCTLLLEHLPQWKDRDVYFWYHGSQLMFQMQGTYWQRWNGALRDLLIGKQETAGPERGSWDPLDNEGPDLWSINKHGGRLYVTALSTMMLEAYYRQKPLVDPTKLAAGN
jgi:hypothetical protein